MNCSFCFREFSRLALAVGGMLMLCQCALPPGTAWTVIRKDGVKDYFAISWGKKPVPEYVKELVPEAFGLPAAEVAQGDEKPQEDEPEGIVETDVFPDVPGVQAEDWVRPVEPVFPLMATELPALGTNQTGPVGAQLAGANPLLGGMGNDEFAVVDLPEPKVVEAGNEKGAAPGLKMKDPAVVFPDVGVVKPLEEGLSGEPKGGTDAGQIMGPPFMGQPKRIEVAKNEVREEGGDGAKVEKFLPNFAAASVTEEVPFGLLVEGRPGYVRSPYAQSHQIVDVTGLKVGAAVKCPFSGKFFRVPAAHAAMNEGVKAEGPVEGKREFPGDKKVES